MDQQLAQMDTSASRRDRSPLTDQEIEELTGQLSDWQLAEEDGIKKLRRTFTFNDFVQALKFTNQVGEIAEQQNHHPIITLTWGWATVTWYSHNIKGLHENDFIMAAKTDGLYSTE